MSDLRPRSGTPEQRALCEKLLPEIVQATEAYFDTEQLHPILKGLADGGLIRSNVEEDTPKTEDFTFLETRGFRDTLMPEMFPEIGIPEHIAANGLMWVLLTNGYKYHRNPRVSPIIQERRREDHCFTYWDGNMWHTRRLIPGSDRNEQSWESMWEPSGLQPEEVLALQAVTKQTRHIHEIADVFGSDSQAFQDMVVGISGDNQPLVVLGTEIVINAPRSASPIPHHVAPYMQYHSTGYQNVHHLLPVADKLAGGRSYELDSGGLQAAGYHGSSLPSSPEMLKSGENIPLRNIHPPVPIEW